jgi:hypothetical protein
LQGVAACGSGANQGQRQMGNIQRAPYTTGKLKDACIEFINSSNRMNNVVASKGYEHLKRACPTIFVDIWEKAAKTRKI